MMALDQCIASTADEATARAAVEITQRWAARSLAARGDSPQSMFGIVQGALFPELRRESAETLGEMPFDGFAIGGLAVGESKSEREDLCEFTAQLLPHDKPRYLMGVGTPLDILEAVHRGVDMFDCIMPTQLAQRGAVFTSRGFLQMRRGVYKFSNDQLDPACTCPTCARYRALISITSRKRARRSAGSSSASTTSISITSSCARFGRAFWPVASPIFTGKNAQLLQESDRENPDPPSEAGARKVALVRQLRSPHRARRFRQHPPDVLRRDHAHAHAADGGGAQPLHRAIASRGAARRAPTSRSSSGMSASARRPTRWPRSSATKQRIGRIGSMDMRPMRLISFENDLDSLRLALRHDDKFPYLRHGGPAGILQKGEWQSKQHPGLSWQLVPGDFLETVAQAPAPPDLIFYDMFSSKTHGEQWTHRDLPPLLRGLRRSARSSSSPTRIRRRRARPCSRPASLSPRVARPGAKEETTIAFTPAALGSPSVRRYELLSSEWIGRWNRSQAKFPAELSAAEQPAFAEHILRHEQFR